MKYKLVIWDLDETFWKGTLSEGKVKKIPRNIDLVKSLVDRGIMNSIVSKNDFSSAMKILKRWDVDKYFIFPKISWNPKGETVKALLQECGLRAENTLFLDDNLSNLEEVKFYNPGITCQLPTYIVENNLLELKEFEGKIDLTHSRLEQYRILEKRIDKKSQFISNEEFLKQSGIVISILPDCNSEIGRIMELIERTNQLNYTKNRMPEEALKNLLERDDTEAAYIRARDNFGDYGIIGFYLIQNKQLIHFLFSCRILGFGIENYIYNKLNAPKIAIQGEVATILDSTKNVDWIKEESGDVARPSIEVDREKEQKERLLFIGGCDLESASRYLESNFEVRKEFNTVVDGVEIRTSDTSQLIFAKELCKAVQDDLCKNIPFLDKSLTYTTDLYSGKYSVIVISLVDDFIRGVYKHNAGDYYITFGSYWNHEKDLTSRFQEEQLEYLRKNFTFEGKESIDLFKSNLEKIIAGVGAAKLIFINGIEIDVSDWIGEDRCQRNIEMNQAIDDVLKRHPEVALVDMRHIVTKRSELIKKDNRHFNRKCYYMMAQEIVRKSEECLNGVGGGIIEIKSTIKIMAEEFEKKLENKIRNFRILRENSRER